MTTTTQAERVPSLGRRMLNKVPEVTLFFWVIKIMCTTVGETAADYLNHRQPHRRPQRRPDHHDTDLRRPPRPRLRHLAHGRAHAVDPLEHHDPPRGVLLAGDPVHLRPRNRRRRPARRESRLGYAISIAIFAGAIAAADA
jgi:hypothetical protein